jgi:hypothetical protein
MISAQEDRQTFFSLAYFLFNQLLFHKMSQLKFHLEF